MHNKIFHKLIFICVSLALFLVFVANVPFADTVGKITIQSSMEGDADLNGCISLADSELIQSYLAGKETLTSDQLNCADTNDDNAVTLKDSTTIKMWLEDSTYPLWQSPADDHMTKPVVCATCTDSDHGKNYYLKGTGTGFENGQIITSTDGCRYDNKTLAEVYCDGNNLKVEQHICPNGCENGACVRERICEQGFEVFEEIDGESKFIAGAKVTVGDIFCLTDSNGYCSLELKDDETHTAIVTKQGYECYNNQCERVFAGCLPEWVNLRLQPDMPLENRKDLSQYSDKMSFLISDTNWRDVLSLVPVAVWTNEDNSISKYPALVYHDEGGNAFDADSTIHFFQQYEPSEIAIVDDSPEELDNLLIAEPELGAGLNQDQIMRIYPEHYLNYWESYRDIVYVEDNYKLALMASTFASLINAPLIIKDYNDDIDFYRRNVICIGNPSVDITCDENYSLEQLQRKYKDLTETQKVVLVDYTDLDKYISGSFVPDKSSPISKLFGKMSLSAPFLAAGKQELIIPIQGSEDHMAVDEQFTNEWLKFFERPSEDYKCRSDESCAQGFSVVEYSSIVASNEVIFHFDLDEQDLPYESFALRFHGFSLDCDSAEDAEFEVYFNDERYGTSLYPPCLSDDDLLLTSSDFIDNIPSDYLQPGKLDIKLVSKGEAKTIIGSLVIDGYNQGYWYCGSLDCISGAHLGTIESIEASQQVSFEFNGLEPEQEYVLMLPAVAGYNVDKLELWINNEKIDYIEKIYCNNNARIVYVNKNLLDEETKIILKPIPFLPDFDMILKISYAKLLPISNFFLTIVSAHNAIPTDLGDEEADIQYYSDIENDGYIDLYTGRIFGVTVSDASSYVARSLFFDDLTKNKDVLVDMVGLDAGSTEEKMREKLYSYGWGDIESQFDNITSCFGWDCRTRKHELREVYDDVSLIIYHDHGNVSGFSSLLYTSYLDSNNVYLNSPTILEVACSTCSVEWNLSEIFCIQNIRRGAMAYNGAVCDGSVVSFQQLFRVFSEHETIGEAFNRERNLKVSRGYHYILLADPTFKPKWW